MPLNAGTLETGGPSILHMPAPAAPANILQTSSTAPVNIASPF